MEQAQTSPILAKLKPRLVLAGYEQPAQPSEVARKLDLPANSVHYWTRRLVAEGLLEQVGENGRIRTYWSLVVAQNPCEPDACVPFIQNVMDILNRVVMTAAEKHDTAGMDSSAPLPEIGIHELQLRAADVQRIVAAFKAALPEPGQEPAPAGDTYTVSFIVAPGGIRQHF